jgi:hypothetical protein
VEGADLLIPCLLHYEESSEQPPIIPLEHGVLALDHGLNRWGEHSQHLGNDEVKHPLGVRAEHWGAEDGVLDAPRELVPGVSLLGVVEMQVRPIMARKGLGLPSRSLTSFHGCHSPGTSSHSATSRFPATVARSNMYLR